jgi:hypothetical protein
MANAPLCICCIPQWLQTTWLGILARAASVDESVDTFGSTLSSGARNHGRTPAGATVPAELSAYPSKTAELGTSLQHGTFPRPPNVSTSTFDLHAASRSIRKLEAPCGLKRGRRHLGGAQQLVSRKMIRASPSRSPSSLSSGSRDPALGAGENEAGKSTWRRTLNCIWKQ